MRGKRLTVETTACYHVMSRIIERRFYLGLNEKAQFCAMLRRVAEFSGVRILTYCVMDNHFHLLVEVPERTSISDKELIRRMRLIYHSDRVDAFAEELRSWRAKGEVNMCDALCDRYVKRMCCLSEFMKTLKQRFSIWYNRNNNRQGTLWEERFKSVLVESSCFRGERSHLMTVAAYIDMNPVRAGLVEDPRDYQWCGCSSIHTSDRPFTADYVSRFFSDDQDAAGREWLRRRSVGFSNGLVLGGSGFVRQIMQAYVGGLPEGTWKRRCSVGDVGGVEMCVARPSRNHG